MSIYLKYGVISSRHFINFFTCVSYCVRQEFIKFRLSISFRFNLLQLLSHLNLVMGLQHKSPLSTIKVLQHQLHEALLLVKKLLFPKKTPVTKSSPMLKIYVNSPVFKANPTSKGLKGVPILKSTLASKIFFLVFLTVYARRSLSSA